MKRPLILLVLSLFAANSFAQMEEQNMAERVRQEFLHAWRAYRQYAWGHDDLKPLSKSFHDWHDASLYMTAVDSLDTLYLMKFTDEADETREFLVKNLRFDHDIYVKNFEITIRILGGLLSSYQLSGDQRLLSLAEDLGKRLLPVFDSPTGMPYMYVNLKTGEVRGSVSNPAEIGTLLIEFGTLSKLSENAIYYEKAKRALVELYKRRSPIGLVGSTINVETGEWENKISHISGGIDSYYEYLLKCARLFGDQDCETMWQSSIKSIHRYLADDAPTGFWYGSADMFSGKRDAARFGSLDAFFPAVLALSGDLVRAERLQDSAYKMWTTFGIEPEEIDYREMKITYEGYALRPEIIESAYYLYHFTHNPRYQKMGKTFLDSLVRYCKTDAGYAALSSVSKKERKDVMESFFLAETLKYLYLLFARSDVLDFDQVVFNTEAHPIRAAWAKQASYEVRTFDTKQGTLPYRILLPENFSRNQKYPLILILHGAGERGKDNQLQLTNGSYLFLRENVRKKFPAIVIFPQCPANSWWSNADFKEENDGKRTFIFQDGAKPTPPMNLLLMLIDHFVQEPYIDRSRVYVGGLSMGGMGTFELLARRPNLFAAAFPICGGGSPRSVSKYAKKVSLWVFHGAEDDVVLPQYSQDMVDALKKADGDVRFTLYPAVMHESWVPAFNEPDLLPWLFSHRKK